MGCSCCLSWGRRQNPRMDASLVQTIASLDMNTSNMSLAQSYGLAIQTDSWEDTARTKNSCWGPNIADLTLHVAGSRLPMIRKPNFADVTADVPMSFFSVTTGNEKPAGALKRVSFKDYVTETLGLPNLILNRDDVLLASAHACVLPCGVGGETEFCPQLFSYQARPDDPAILVFVASSQETSAHVITGAADKLLFNRGGAAAMFLAKRLSQERRERGVSEAGAMTDDELDRNAILLFQIPLKQRSEATGFVRPYIPIATGSRRRASPLAGLEFATLRASEKTYGPFRGLARFKLERNARFPIRVTFQMYTVTDDPVLKESQIKSLADKIEKVYVRGKETGSLVTNTTNRATEPRPLGSVMGAEQMPSFNLRAE
ncbi:hypothetical protein KFL_004390080 [Klebsormidium nitens]|uniref:Uncharacterized protein n=1 Tax=Klebsormidium nitens TaxID=105231 RepID=A0A1Y1ICB8_KLENI|nr:hypothetical protein KFL_004390080 [Klebsormidium nitens]|eukprot:GAQ88560.1 hypothetical protein KFL_004390080 [Klebsormidium nitens]